MKIGVIGAGAVGSACLLSIVMGGCAREIVVLNRNRKRAIAVATDMQYGATLSSAVDIRDGDYPDLAGAALVMITAGVNEKTGGATDRSDPAGRLKLLDQNVDVYRQILPQLLRVAPEAVVLVVTDPPDPLADLVRMFGFERVLSSGTFLDSLRFRFHFARQLNVNPNYVDAQILGEHGTSQVFLWSSASLAGVSPCPTPCSERIAAERSFNAASSTMSVTPISPLSKETKPASSGSASCRHALRKWCCATSAP